MQNLFSIGEISLIFSETKETFRHYDRVGLLKPYYVKENGYRYYSLDQFEVISTILHLRSIGTSIDQIKELLHSRSRSAIIQELSQQREDLKKTIDKLKYLEYQAANLMDRFISFTADEIYVSDEPALYVLMQDFTNEQLAVDPKDISSFHEGIDSEWIKYSNIVSFIRQEDLLHDRFHQYAYYGILSEQPCSETNPFYHRFEPRKYLIGCVRITTFAHTEIDSMYERILGYIAENGFTINGDCFERNILTLYNDQSEGDIHYIKIYIPIT
ncbi:MAG: MerR family transcriptional regulator [Lachnospiraceae bacterium]